MSLEPCREANTPDETTAPATRPTRRLRKKDATERFTIPRKPYSSPAHCSGVVSVITTR